MFNRIFGIAGLGLMGGSFAKAIRLALPESKIFATDNKSAVLEDAKERGIIDDSFLIENAGEMLSACDFIFICLYPRDVVRFFKKHRDDFKSGSIITDISGVKSGVVDEMVPFLRDDVDFICGHPMAGSEKEGFANSSDFIFVERNYILMPLASNKKENLEFFKTLMHKIGFSRITETDFESHDRKIAFTSQLCHIIASSLVESAEDAEITAFGGGSFEDLTRIAMINAPLWTELFLANKKYLLPQIAMFENSLEKIKLLIENNNDDELTHVLEGIRKKRTAMSRKESVPHNPQKR